MQFITVLKFLLPFFLMHIFPHNCNKVQPKPLNSETPFKLLKIISALYAASHKVKIKFAYIALTNIVFNT